MLATGSGRKTTIYDVNTEAQIHQWDHKGTVNSVCFSPDGSMLATGDDACKTSIYDVTNESQIYQWDHHGAVFSVCFSPKQYPKPWESYNNGEALYVYNAQELKRWLNTNKKHYQTKHDKTPLTNRLIYGVQFLTQEEINQQEAISQNTQETPEKRLRDMIEEIRKIDEEIRKKDEEIRKNDDKISNSSLKVVINALTSKREEIMEEFVELYNREKNNLLKLQTEYPNFIKHILEDSSDDSSDSDMDEEDDESDDERKVDELMHDIQLRF